jgi:hypothetical protein
MANKQPSVQQDIPAYMTGKPLQVIPYSQKTPEWYHRNAEYYIRNSWTMTSSGGINDNAIAQLYEVYNNEFPLSWFTHLTDPLNAKKKQHKRFPAKIRPINILRTSIDLLINELSQRPFVVQVVNTGEKAYNEFQDRMQQKLVQNLSLHFMKQVQNAAAAEGVEGVDPPMEEEIPLPKEVQERFLASYSDNQAIKGQRWLQKTIDEQSFIRKRNLMMKDYLISGWFYSFQNIVNGKYMYERVSPMELKYGMSPNTIFVKDAAWAVRRYYMTTADAVEQFYQTLSEESIKKIYARTASTMHLPFNGQMFYNYLKDNINSAKELVPIYHTVWRGKKGVKILTYPDPVTGQLQEMEVDEDYPVDKKAGESARTEWRDEVYQCYRLLEDIYCEEGPLPIQNGALPYNGRAFSNTHAQNISVLQIGLPFQMMVMILNWTIERMIAKSKGKILLMDVNAVPTHGDWDEEKFFYYGEALGYFLMDRDNRKVDKSWNQYTVLDMSMYENIKQLIDLQNHYRQMWDDVLGITMPRKGQTFASSSPTNNERSLFQSNIITDNIFTSFEEGINEDLNQMLEFSRILVSEGTKDLYTSDLMDHELLNIDPVQYCNAMLNVMVKTSAKEQRRLDEAKMYMQEMLQNGASPSTILEIILTENIAELRTKLKFIEQTAMKAEQQTAANEEEAKKALLEIEQQFKIFETEMAKELIDKEWDRKDQNTMIKGEYDIVSFTKSEDNDGDGTPDAAEIADRVIKRFKIMSDERTKLAAEANKAAMHQDKMDVERMKAGVQLEGIAAKERGDKLKAKAAAKKASAAKKK